MKSPLAELKAFEFPAVMCEKSILEVDLETRRRHAHRIEYWKFDKSVYYVSSKLDFASCITETNELVSKMHHHRSSS